MKTTALFIILLSLTITCTISCNKISESIQRDVVVTDTVLFDIPVLSSITSTTTIPDISPIVNLSDEIHKQVNNFDVSNVSSVKLKSLDMALGLIPEDSVDAKNNFGNLETIKFQIATGAQQEEIANTAISSPSILGALALSPVVRADVLKSYLTDGASHYNVLVKAKTATTTVMQVRAAITYTVTLAK